MKLACLTFTQNGAGLANQLQAHFEGQVDIFSKENYKANLPRIFQDYEGIVFLASTGIAVRLSTPFLQDKAHDPAVIVVDDLGRYTISLLSGHLGGANALAQTIADILGCQPIITTASDGRGFEAVDLFAQRNGFIIENLEDAKSITAIMVDGHPIQMVSDIEVSIDYPHLVQEQPAGCIYVTSQAQITCPVPYCILRPKILHVGIGCRKGKPEEEILKAIHEVFQTHNLSIKSLASVATVEAKQHEVGIHEACAALDVPLRIFTNQEIHAVQHQFTESTFVQSHIGVTAVCEPCAYLAGGRLIVPKTAVNGITVAVAQRT